MIFPLRKPKRNVELRHAYVRFADFEVDFDSHELRKNSRRVKLQDQPFRVLKALLERPGEIVTRDQLKEILWPEHTHVEFDRGLGTAMGKLRSALNDRATKPRFVETVPRRGFRFIAPVEWASGPTSGSEKSQLAEPTRARRWGKVLLVCLLVLAAVGVTFVYRDVPSRQLDSVVVLPLQNLTGDPGEEYFADGMTEALIHGLAGIDGLDVISRTTSMRYKGSSKSLPRIARDLNVDAVVEGSVIRSGGHVRIYAQLVDADRDLHVWSESFEQADEDVLALQREVALAVAQRMRSTLGRPLELEQNEIPRVDPAAYEDYLRGRFFLAQTGRTAVRRAVTFLERSVEADPDHAPAQACLSKAYCILRRSAATAREELRTKARASALRAVELDEELAAAHSSLGYVKMYDYDWEGAARSFERALLLDPQDEMTVVWYNNFLTRMRRWEEARDLLENARVLNPLSPMISTGLARLACIDHQPDVATEICQQMMELEPKSSLHNYCLGLADLERGDYPKAIEAFRRAYDLGGSNLHIAVLSYACGRAGDTAEAQRLQNELFRRSEEGYLVSGALAITYVGLGEPEQALDWLEKGYEQGDPLLVDLNYYPLLQRLRSEPRYQALLERMAFPTS